MLYEVITSVIKSNGRSDEQTQVEINKLADVFRQFRLVPKQFDRLVSSMRDMIVITSYSIHYTKLYEPRAW